MSWFWQICHVLARGILCLVQCGLWARKSCWRPRGVAFYLKYLDPSLLFCKEGPCFEEVPHDWLLPPWIWDERTQPLSLDMVTPRYLQDYTSFSCSLIIWISAMLELMVCTITLLFSVLISYPLNAGGEFVHLVNEEYQAPRAIIQCLPTHWTSATCSVVPCAILYWMSLNINKIMVQIFTMCEVLFYADLTIEVLSSAPARLKPQLESPVNCVEQFWITFSINLQNNFRWLIRLIVW